MTKRIDDIADLTPDKTNANKGTQRGRGMVEASLRETGAGRSIVADKNGQVIAGNKTLEAWVDIGGEIEVVRTDGKKLVVVQREDLDLSDDTGMARKLAYYDNRAGEVGLEWDTEQLLADMNAGVDLTDLFRQDELDELLADLLPKPEASDAPAQVDKAAELQAKWQTATGQLWQLGEHRLICGDCTDADVVARVMGGEKADMVFTDPPYGIKRDEGFEGFGGFGPPIARRQYADDWDSARPTKATFDLLLGVADKAILFGGNFFADILPQSKHWLVWDKLNTMPTFGDCELVWTNIDRTSVKKYTVQYNGLIGKEKERFHPTQKPVEIMAQILGDYTEPNEAILEPFSGSGTTIIACEQLGRKCRAVEISPAYVAVALQRWADATGKTPVLIS